MYDFEKRKKNYTQMQNVCVTKLGKMYLLKGKILQGQNMPSCISDMSGNWSAG